MPTSRRLVLSGSAAGAASLATGLSAPAYAQYAPIKIGYLPALTGPSSSTGVGIDRGVQLGVEEINKAGGVDGRKIEPVSRDTRSDPTKAVNAVAELTHRQEVAMNFRPVNSGEALAATPSIARDKVPVLVDRVLAAVVRLREAGTTVLLVEQLIEKAVAVVDRAYALARGSIVLEARASEGDLANRLEHACFGADASAPVAAH